MPADRDFVHDQFAGRRHFGSRTWWIITRECGDPDTSISGVARGEGKRV
ncbi:hypothetical protein GIY56_12480 [Paracoccus sp. YIM 132242]|uniref:Uncharacterized protein n=1 Tax=Paracoccus lichenicola TaxID=2665644 RepID=A0A6L6HS03_9RHOB|nr:hypothetical protein [Paracoccus lichenicola]MTE01112.1 hypothetical protein [Paracoccus lichenicola]